MENRTFSEIVEQVINRNPNLKGQEYIVRQTLTTLSDLIQEDVYFDTDAEDTVMWCLVEYAKQRIREETNH